MRDVIRLSARFRNGIEGNADGFFIRHRIEIPAEAQLANADSGLRLSKHSHNRLDSDCGENLAQLTG